MIELLIPQQINKFIVYSDRPRCSPVPFGKDSKMSEKLHFLSKLGWHVLSNKPWCFFLLHFSVRDQHMLDNTMNQEKKEMCCLKKNENTVNMWCVSASLSYYFVALPLAITAPTP